MDALLKASAQLEHVRADRGQKKLLDSGANISIVSSLSHLDPDTTPSFHRVDKPFNSVETANNSTMKIDEVGKFKNMDSAICQ